MLERQTNVYTNERVAQEFRTFREAVKESGTVKNVLGGYQKRKLQFTILGRFATIIFLFYLHRPKMRANFLLMMFLQDQTMQGCG